MKKVSESVLAGHPDKICDQVADAILDEFLRRDKDSRVNLEVFAGHGAMMISGSVESRADFDCAAVARQVYKQAGYEDEVEPFVHLGEMNSEWSGLVSGSAAIDQVICRGYATKATREMVPAAAMYAREIAKKIDEARVHDASMSWLRPDGRVLVAMDGKNVSHVSVFCQHDEGVKVQEIHGGILEKIIKPVVGDVSNVKLFVNPAGPFTKGGLSCGAGQSGRRASSDLYGGLIPHGSVTLSGKDPSHPARAGSYMARHIAKSLVAAGKAKQAIVKIVYTIGRVDPIIVEAIGDAGEDLTELVKSKFDLKIDSIVKEFDLKRPIYRRLATEGQVGVSDVLWEEVREL